MVRIDFWIKLWWSSKGFGENQPFLCIFYDPYVYTVFEQAFWLLKGKLCRLWFQPMWKIWYNLGHFPQYGVNIKMFQNTTGPLWLHRNSSPQQKSSTTTTSHPVPVGCQESLTDPESFHPPVNCVEWPQRYFCGSWHVRLERLKPGWRPGYSPWNLRVCP